MKIIIILLTIFLSFKSSSQNLEFSGYTQLRYNKLFETNPNLGCEQCDGSWGGTSGFFFRRIRVKLQSELNDHVFLFIQPDFASGLNMTQIRDAYVDLYIDKEKVWRFRVGQSKVPFGFENLQSSQNRLPLDRNDALNSAVSNERDIGVFFYWTPTRVTKLHNYLIKEGLKGSGNYGVFGLGVYNGQLANQIELNNTQHIVSRISYPFEFKKQILELGISGYTGYYTLPKNNISSGVLHNQNLTYKDERLATHIILYPKPFGLQFEYNVGRGPEFDNDKSISVNNLNGGYLMFNYKFNYKDKLIYPFIRYQYYSGGKKHEIDARSYDVNELEVGGEFLLNKNLEIVVMYTFSDRRYEDFILINNHQVGSLLRIQLQINF
jgi:hypothetical protein